MNDDQISGTIRDFIVERYLGGDSSRLTASTRLTSGGILDSLSTVEIMLFLESRYGIDLADVDLDSPNFETLDSIVALVRRKLNTPE